MAFGTWHDWEYAIAHMDRQVTIIRRGGFDDGKPSIPWRKFAILVGDTDLDDARKVVAKLNGEA